MKSLSYRLVQLRLDAGLTAEELAHRLGVGKTTIINYETGYLTPSEEILLKLARIFDVSAAYFTGPRPECALEPQSIPVISRLSDMGKTTDAGNIIDYIYLPGQLASGYEYFGLKAEDNSMNLARIFAGDILLVRKQDYADNGDIIVFRGEDGWALVRRYYKNINFITLLADSTNICDEPIQMSSAEFSSGVVGRVMQVIISF